MDFDLGAIIFWSIIEVIAVYLVYRFFRINTALLFSIPLIITLALPLFNFNSHMSIEESVNFLSNYITSFINILPSIISGEIAAAILVILGVGKR